MLILPELVVLSGALLFFAASLTRKPQPKQLHLLALFCGLAVLASACTAFRAEGLLFSGSYSLSQFSQFFKILLAGAFFFVLIDSHRRG